MGTTKKNSEKTTSNDDGINPDFKAAMDSYEKFMDEYVAFMKKYKENPSDLGLLADYADYMSKYTDFVKDFEKWENQDMNAGTIVSIGLEENIWDLDWVLLPSLKGNGFIMKRRFSNIASTEPLRT